MAPLGNESWLHPGESDSCLSGVGASDGIIIRAAKVDLGPTRAAAEAGRERRLEHGLLTSDAAGESPAAQVESAMLTAMTSMGVADG